MPLSHLRFTLGHLIKLIAVLAVFLATLRTPFWPLVLGISIILAGFAIDRARGGAGIYGAMLGGVVGAMAFALVVFALVSVLIGYRGGDLPRLIVAIFAAPIVGGAGGVCLGFWACLIANFISGDTTPLPPTVGPIVGPNPEDLCPRHSQAGRSQP